MTRRDWDLLDKQFAWLRPAPRHGSLKLAAVIATLLAGIASSGAVVLHGSHSAGVAGSPPAPSAVVVSFSASPRG